jgi:predicted adenine nucleotide alpha hydrolase (AANH) superfamily ATPase
MLVHICCSVDSHYFLARLQETFPDETLVGYFYNPNVHPYEEYVLRLQDVQRSCAALGIALIEGKYDVEGWLSDTKGLEAAPEKGARCAVCRVCQNHTFIGIYGVHMVFIAGKSPYIWSYTVCIYGSGQP